MSVVAK